MLVQQPEPNTTSTLNLARGWINTPFFVAAFAGILCFYHVLQWCAHQWSLSLQRYTLNLMNLSIVLNIRLLAGARYKVYREHPIPKDRPVIIVSNHQSMYDIPMMMWELRDRDLGFIAKKELGKGIPSISYALRELGSALIDRSDPRQAIEAISALGHRKEETKEIAVIFPEGTRARDGKVKSFKLTGFKALLESMPSAVIVPVVVTGNWELLQYNFKPVPAGVSITMQYLPYIEPAGQPAAALLKEIEGRIRESLES